MERYVKTFEQFVIDLNEKKSELLKESYGQFSADKKLNEAITIRVSLRYAREAGELFTDMGGSRLGKIKSSDVWEFKKPDDAGEFVNTLINKIQVPSNEIYSDNKNIRKEYGVSESVDESRSASNEKFFMDDLLNYFEQGDTELVLKINSLKKSGSGWVIDYELDAK